MSKSYLIQYIGVILGDIIIIQYIGVILGDIIIIQYVGVIIETRPYNLSLSSWTFPYLQR